MANTSNARKKVLYLVILTALAIAFIAYFVGSEKSLSAGDQVDADGIRPDVRHEIEKMFPHSEKKRTAAIFLAQKFQMAINNPEDADNINTQYEAAKSCLRAIEHTGGTTSVVSPDTPTSTRIEAIVVNSYKRARAYNRYNGKLSGRVFPTIAPDISKCEFDPSKLKD